MVLHTKVTLASSSTCTEATPLTLFLDPQCSRDESMHSIILLYSPYLHEKYTKLCISHYEESFGKNNAKEKRKKAEKVKF